MCRREGRKFSIILARAALRQRWHKALSICNISMYKTHRSRLVQYVRELYPRNYTMFLVSHRVDKHVLFRFIMNVAPNKAHQWASVKNCILRYNSQEK